MDTSGGTTTTTWYVAGIEDVSRMQGLIGTTFTKYEGVLGLCTVVLGGSGPSETISYVFTDGLGGVSEALDGNRTVTAQQLYGPYGTGRFALAVCRRRKATRGSMAIRRPPASYYGTRYYDPLVGQFASADPAGDGLNRYAYVADDPETVTDPTGQYRCDDTGCKRGGGNGGKGGCTFDCKGTPSGGCTQNCGSCKSNCGGGKGGGGKGGGGKGDPPKARGIRQSPALTAPTSAAISTATMDHLQTKQRL